MTQISHPTSALENYTQDYSDLFKDKRLFTGFQATITGILGSGTTRIAQIAKSAPQTGTSPHSEQRLRRLIHNKNQRADLTPAKIGRKFTARGAKRLAKHDEVKVILDGSDLRKPYSTSGSPHVICRLSSLENPHRSPCPDPFFSCDDPLDIDYRRRAAMSLFPAS